MGTPDPPPTDAAVVHGAPTDERLLEVLAELDLVRRNASSLEARLRRWEERLDGACRVVDDLLGAEADRRDPVDRLAELERRVERLDRRRSVSPVDPRPPAEVDTEPPRPASPPLDLPDTVAIVRARWLVDDQPVSAPAEVELCADVDGIDAGEPVTVEIMPLGAHTAVATLAAVSDGDRITATWQVPRDSEERAWKFVVRYGAAESVSPPLHVT